jgi:radical SAM protein with 4Fe4S-binding SPASM domain
MHILASAARHQPRGVGQKIVCKAHSPITITVRAELGADTHVPKLSVVGRIPYRDMMIQVFQHDYAKVGHDRGGILEGIGRQDFVRTAACAVPIKMMVISYNGNVLPCCHFVGDADAHQSLIVGRLGKGKSLFEIYASPEYLAWRRGLFAIGDKGKACRNCVDYADFASMQIPAALSHVAHDGIVDVIGGSSADRPVEGVFRLNLANNEKVQECNLGSSDRSVRHEIT